MKRIGIIPHIHPEKPGVEQKESLRVGHAREVRVIILLEVQQLVRADPRHSGGFLDGQLLGETRLLKFFAYGIHHRAMRMRPPCRLGGLAADEAGN